VGITLADHLGEDVEAAGGDHHVVHLLDGRHRLGHRLQLTLDDDADHGLAREPELQRIGDRHDLHHAGGDELFDAVLHSGLGEPDGLSDVGIGAAPVGLQLFDDRLGGGVDDHAGGGIRSVVSSLADPV
jgi:hypothetical protein